MKARLLVTLQLAVIAALLLTGPWIARTWLALEAAGCGLLLWALATIRLRQLRISPEVRQAHNW